MQYLIIFQENIVGTFTNEKSYAIEGKENGKDNFCYDLSKSKKDSECLPRRVCEKCQLNLFFIRRKHVLSNKFALFLSFPQNKSG